MSRVRIKFEIVEEIKATNLEDIIKECEEAVKKVQTVYPDAIFLDMQSLGDDNAEVSSQ